jgi:hypothetical protein
LVRREESGKLLGLLGGGVRDDQLLAVFAQFLGGVLVDFGEGQDRAGIDLGFAVPVDAEQAGTPLAFEHLQLVQLRGRHLGQPLGRGPERKRGPAAGRDDFSGAHPQVVQVREPAVLVGDRQARGLGGFLGQPVAVVLGHLAELGERLPLVNRAQVDAGLGGDLGER